MFNLLKPLSQPYLAIQKHCKYYNIPSLDLIFYLVVSVAFLFTASTPSLVLLWWRIPSDFLVESNWSIEKLLCVDEITSTTLFACCL